MLRQIRQFWGRWARRTRGAAAIEFALLCWPYFLLIFGIIEIGWMFASVSMVETATLSASRGVVTGGMDPTKGQEALRTEFKTAICDTHGAAILLGGSEKCKNDKLKVTAIPVSNFTDFINNPKSYIPDPANPPFNIGASNQMMIIQVEYAHDMMTPMIGNIMGGADHKIEFMTTVATQNEPY